MEIHYFLEINNSLIQTQRSLSFSFKRIHRTEKAAQKHVKRPNLCKIFAKPLLALYSLHQIVTTILLLNGDKTTTCQI